MLTQTRTDPHLNSKTVLPIVKSGPLGSPTYAGIDHLHKACAVS